mmetsp:Transcript_13555/g.33296  ORF Transcript_13555/g.33296 Transcript_13555/m.33296 type:complete len:202 (-) Transcript_13555:160-765(-)
MRSSHSTGFRIDVKFVPEGSKNARASAAVSSSPSATGSSASLSAFSATIFSRTTAATAARRSSGRFSSASSEPQQPLKKEDGRAAESCFVTESRCTSSAAPSANMLTTGTTSAAVPLPLAATAGVLAATAEAPSSLSSPPRPPPTAARPIVADSSTLFILVWTREDGAGFLVMVSTACFASSYLFFILSIFAFKFKSAGFL